MDTSTDTTVTWVEVNDRWTLHVIIITFIKHFHSTPVSYILHQNCWCWLPSIWYQYTFTSPVQIHLPYFSSLPLCFVPLRLIVRSGNSSLSSPLFDSDLDDVPERGLLSESSTLYLELTADSSSIPLLLALRYEGEQRHFRYLDFFLYLNLTGNEVNRIEPS